MQITVKILHPEKSIVLNAEGFDTVLDVKYKIQEKEGIPPHEQRLAFSGKVLNHNHITLADYNIEDKSTLDLVVCYVYIFVHTISGLRIILEDIPWSQTIGYVKAKLMEIEGCPVDQQRLFFGRCELEDGTTLAYYGIKRGSTLHQLLLPRRDMKITIKTVAPKKTITLDVKSYNTLLEVKYIIQEKEGIPHDEQQCIMLGKELQDDDKTLADYNIHEKSTLWLDVRHMYIFVKTLSGRRLVVKDMSYLETIGDVKDKLKDMEGRYPVDQQRLMFGRYELEDDKTLAYYDIHRGSTIHQLLHLRGGMKIFVKTLTGKTITLEVESCDTIETVKAKVHDIQERENCA